MYLRGCFSSFRPFFGFPTFLGHPSADLLGKGKCWTHTKLLCKMVEEQQFLGIQPLWTTDSVWRDSVASLVNFPPRLSVMELCAGARTASISLKFLLGHDKAEFDGLWNISPDLAPIFRTVHGNLDIKVTERNTLEHLICPRWRAIARLSDPRIPLRPLRDFPCVLTRPVHIQVGRLLQTSFLD